MKKLFLLGAALLGLFTFGPAAHAGGDEPDDYNYRPQPRVYEGRPVYRERVVVDEDCPPPVYVRHCLPPPPVVYGGYYGGPRPYGYGYGYHRRHFFHRPVVSFGIGF